MIKTVFGKIMLLFMVILFSSVLISGFLTSGFIRNATLNESEQQMLATAEDTGTLVSFYINNSLSLEQITGEIFVRASANQYAVWVVNTDGSPWLTIDMSGGDVALDKELIQAYYNNMIEELNKGNSVKILTDASGVFQTPVMTVAAPVIYEGDVIGYTFVHQQIRGLDRSLDVLYRQIVLAACIAAMLGTVLTYVFSRNILRPLKVVTAGARQLAKGHFDIHLAVRSKDEIGQLAHTFNNLTRDLKKYETARESLVANVSHELRSPLTSVQGLVQAVLDGTIPPEEANHYLEVVLEETRRLNRLINEMLDLSKIESGQFPLEISRVDLNEQILRVLLTFENKIDQKKVQIDLRLAEEKIYVSADPNRLIQILHNLIENAIKFVNEEGTIRITTAAHKDRAQISIFNTGERISPEDLPSVFDRFYKTDKSHTREKEGTGLGLSIVKNLLKAHGQTITAESDGEGTTFTFTLKKI